MNTHATNPGATACSVWHHQKAPNPAQVMQMDRQGRPFWLALFAYSRPVPDSGIIAWVDLQTGEVEVEVE
jgi:hypothetical protein